MEQKGKEVRLQGFKLPTYNISTQTTTHLNYYISCVRRGSKPYLLARRKGPWQVVVGVKMRHTYGQEERATKNMHLTTKEGGLDTIKEAHVYLWTSLLDPLHHSQLGGVLSILSSSTHNQGPILNKSITY